MVNTALVDLFKLASSFCVSSGVSTIVGYAAKSSVPKIAPAMIRSRPFLVGTYHAFQKVAIPAGAVALAGMAADQAVKYSNQQIDDNVMLYEKMKAKAEEVIDKTIKDPKPDEESGEKSEEDKT